MFGYSDTTKFSTKYLNLIFKFTTMYLGMGASGRGFGPLRRVRLLLVLTGEANGGVLPSFRASLTRVLWHNPTVIIKVALSI